MMEKLVVKNQNFENSIKELDKLSKKDSKLCDLPEFQEKGRLLRFVNAKVTGADMNIFTEQLQQNLMILNSRINTSYQQFVEVYHAFEALDKEYIAGIVGAFNQAVEATKKAEDAQRDINNTVEALQKAVTKMGEFNLKVSEELTLIDAVNWREKAIQHKIYLDGLDQKLDGIVQTVDEYKASHEELKLTIADFKSTLEQTKSALEDHVNEKRRIRKNIKILWIALGAFATIALILLGVLFLKVFYDVDIVSFIFRR